MTHSMHELKELFEKATKGNLDAPKNAQNDIIWIDSLPLVALGHVESKHDRALIVALHNTFPSLLARMDALEAVAEAAHLRLLHDGYYGTYDASECLAAGNKLNSTLYELDRLNVLPTPVAP